MSCEKTIFPTFIGHPQPTRDREMGEKRKRVEIENGHDEAYPLHNEALTRNGSTNNRTVVI
jgi:hypothetical protein